MKTLIASLAVTLSAPAWADTIPFDELAPRAAAVKPVQTEPDERLHADVLVLKFHEGSRVRLEDGLLVAHHAERTEAEAFRLERADLDADQIEVSVQIANDLLAGQGMIERLFVEADPEALAMEQAAGEQLTGEELADLDLYYQVVLDVPDVMAIAELADALNQLAGVEIAYAQPIAEDAAPDLHPPTTNHVPQQDYLNAAGNGFDAQAAWTWPGGRGEGVRMVDVETSWQLDHEDLPPVFVNDGWHWGDGQHGVASLGIVAAENNAYGMTGMASDTEIGVISPVPFYNLPAALKSASELLSAGDILLIEQHLPGPTDGAPPCVENCSQFGYVAVEERQAEFDVIRRATALGVIVIEPAGNGSMNLDHARYGSKFDRTVRDSGAIMVGAGWSANLTLNNGDVKAVREPHLWSNAGGRVDVHGWGDSVATLGYGTPVPQTGPNPMRAASPHENDKRQWYTTSFGGTSAASPQVAASAASIQGIRMAAGLERLSPRAMRQLLVQTGVAQNAPLARNIGPRPDLADAIDAMHLTRDQARFRHTANSSNTPSTWVYIGHGCFWYPCIPEPMYMLEYASHTVLDHPDLNGKPGAIVQLMPHAGVANPHAAGVHYDVASQRWRIVHLDDQPIIDQAAWHVLITHGFDVVSIPQNTTGNRLWFDDPVADGDSGARLQVTRWTGPGDVRSDAPIAVEFDSAQQRWSVVQTNGAPIPDGAGFHISVRHTSPSDSRALALAPLLVNGELQLQHPMLDGRAEALFTVTAFEAPLAGNLSLDGDVAARFDVGQQSWFLRRIDGQPLQNFHWLNVYVARDLEQAFVPVHESGTGVQSSVTVRDGDVVRLDTGGEIWAGVWLTGRNDADGWVNDPAPAAYPLPGADKYSLIGRFGNDPWFAAGRFDARNPIGPERPVHVRINDDVPGNGDHWMLSRIRRFRE
jgi:hypothetical protein